MNRRAGFGIWGLAFAVRVLPMLLGGGTSAILEYDDGVHYSAALATMSGHAPYRSFTFVQPPGAIYLFSPEALIGKLTSDGFGLLLARLVVAGAAATTAYLIYRIVSRESVSAGLIAGAIYAVWEPAVLAGRTALLEPLLTLFVVLSFDLLDERRPRKPALSGAAFAAACLFKLWAGALLPIILIVVWRRFGANGVRRWLAGALGTGVVLLAPFLIAAPTQLWQRVVLDQAARPAEGGSVFDRLQFLSGWSFNSSISRAATVHGSAIVAVIIMIAAIALGLRHRSSRVWVCVLVVNVGIVIAAPSFGYHYVEIVVAPIAVCLGTAIAEVHAPRQRQVEFGVLVLLLVALVLSVTARGATRLPSRVEQALRAAKCPWTMSASVTVAADVQHRVCGGRIDYYGDYLRAVRRSGHAASPVAVDGYQQLLRQGFGAADVAVIQPGDRSSWDSATSSAFDTRFTMQFTSGDFTVYAAG